MKQSIVKSISFYIPNLTSRLTPSPRISFSRPCFNLRFRSFSSKNQNFSESDLSSDESSDTEYVSTQELKQQIDRFYKEGDPEAIPSIFESILKRKLVGKGDESDDELMNELREHHPKREDVSDKEYESDSDEL